MMKTANISAGWGILLALLLGAVPARAVTVAQLRDRLASGDKPVIIDIRSPSLYRREHIPDAINIPARVIARKKLPPLGEVIVYGGGLGEEDVAAAVAALNAKPGIRAEALEGGFAAWKGAHGSTTLPPGLHEDPVRYITYDSLRRAAARDEDIVLVDLRRRGGAGGLSRQGVSSNAPVDLSRKFPGKTVVKSPFDVPGVPGSGRLARQADAPPPLLVLIDDGDGRAREMARVLAANGARRVVVLAGGEKILERDGRPGLERIGMGSTTLEADHADQQP